MIRLIDIRLNAAHPELPLAEAVTYTGAPSTMLIRGVPGNCGKWCITSVYVAATFPDGSTSTRLAVQSANGVWVATLPATATSGRTASGVRIMADGEDENGEIVTGYILGVADFAVASLGVTPAPEPGATSWQMLYFDTVPGVLRKGDVTKIDGVLKLYNGTAWEPFADLSGCVPTSRTINGKALTDNVSLSGADIPVDATPGAQKIDAALAGKLDKSGGIADDLLICGANEAIKFDDSFLYMYRKINGAWVAQNVWDLRTSQDGIVAFLSDIYDAVQQIAPVFTAKTYAANDLCTYNGVVYRCKMGYTATASSAKPDADTTHWEAKKVSELFLPLTGGMMSGDLNLDYANLIISDQKGVKVIDSPLNSTTRHYTYFTNDYIEIGYEDDEAPANDWYFQLRFNRRAGEEGGTLALAAPNPTAGNLAALDAQGNPKDSGIAAGDLLTIVALTNSAETMASILSRLNAINAAHKHVFFDCSGIDVNPRLYLCTIMIDVDANAVRVYDQVTGKLYIGPYVAAETIGEVFAKAVDAYHSITVSAVTLDGVTVTGQTVTIREGTDATAPVYATATITDGAPVVFVVPKGMIYFLEITDTLADHFGPRVTSGSGQGIATADAAVTFTYYDAEHIDTSEITTFAKLQEALTWFGTNEEAARNNLVGIEIADTWTATNGTVYDNPRVVWDVHYFEDENGVNHLGALMGTKYCSYNDVQFDAAEGEECNSSTETVAEADVYYYGLAIGETSKTAANLTLLELSTGTALPYADYAKIYKSAIRDTTRSSLQYGYNNWRDSAYRQYLNSDAATGQWWGATHIGDVAPSQLSSVRGFMAGCSAALLAAAKKVKVATWPNYITDGPDQITTLYETLDTFFLPSGSEVYGDANRNGGASVEGELSPYWQARTGYTAPNNASTSTRIIYRELPVGSTASRSAANVRLRSAYRGSSNSVWVVVTSGQVYNGGHAYSALASVPACVIY